MWRLLTEWLSDRTRDEEIEREIRTDLELEAEEQRDAGVSPEGARLAARRAFGSTAIVTEDTRAVWRWSWLDRLRQDVRYAARTARRSPGFTAVTLLILALGIGATTTIFSIVHSVLLRPLPFREPDRLMMVDEKWLPRFPHFEASPKDFVAWRAQSRAFAELSAFVEVALTLTGRDRPERIAAARVSGNLPSLLGVEPVIGRTFTPDEDRAGGNRVILLGHGLWQRAFGASPGVIGSTLTLDGAPFTVVGVMPAGFHFPQGTELWTPMGFTDKELESRGNHFVWAIGRLKPGVSREQAQAEMDVIMPRLQQVWGANVIPLMDHYVGDVRLALAVLLGAAALVLLIACVNVANLLLARAAVRQREIDLRASLGASRGRIIRQLLTESVLLSVVGGLLGLALAYLTLGAVRQTSFATIPRLSETTLDLRVLSFALVLSALTGIAFGLTPAIRLSGGNLQRSLKAGHRTGGAEVRALVRNALIVGELALALVLLSGAGLLLKSFWRLVDAKPGFDALGVVTASVNLPALDYREPYQQVQFATRLLERLQARADVRAAALSAGLPFATVGDSGIHFDGRPAGPLSGTAANHYRVTPHYLRALGLPLVRGRFFDDDDTLDGRKVVLINETMARRFFSDEDPIGKRLDIGGPTYWREIVGVVGDVRQDGLRATVPPQVYEPFFQTPGRAFTIVVRSANDDAVPTETLREEVRAIDPRLALANVRSMDQIVEGSIVRDRFAALLLGVFAALALLLAAIGIYGVMAFAVARRTNEIGVRMALGAHPGAILRLVLGQSVRLVLVGLALGLAVSMAVTRVLGTLLYDVTPRDPATLLVVSVLLVAVATLAAFIPARRAAHVDPVVALRSE